MQRWRGPRRLPHGPAEYRALWRRESPPGGPSDQLFDGAATRRPLGGVSVVVRRARVLVAAEQHRDEHASEHTRVLGHHQGALCNACPEHDHHCKGRDEHRGGHLDIRPPGVSAVAHPGDHRHRHRERHREHVHRRRQARPARAERAEQRTGRRHQDEHPGEHDEDHLGVVAEEPVGRAAIMPNLAGPDDRVVRVRTAVNAGRSAQSMCGCLPVKVINMAVNKQAVGSWAEHGASYERR